jgi:hypothetical protein
MEQMAKESGAKVGGTLYSDALSDEEGAGRDLYRYDQEQHWAVHCRFGKLNHCFR